MRSFTINKNPVGKERPRFTKTGHVYTPQKTLHFESDVKKAYKKEAAENSWETIVSDVVIKINFYFSIPKAVSKKRRQDMIDGKVRPTVKPDIDNCIKSILDGLEKGGAFSDDKIVTSIISEKVYGEYPHIDVTIKERK